MGPCADHQNLLLDLLYGLLEPDEERWLRAHMAECPACQAALAEAQSQQRLLARAAHVSDRVPAFDVPADLPAPAVQTPVTAGSPDPPPALVPLPRRGRKLRKILGWSVAASLLLAAGVLWGLYQHGLDQRRTELAQAQTQVEEVDTHFLQVRKSFDDKQAKVPTAVHGASAHLHIMGPAQFEADAPSPVRVSTRELAGKPLPALVTTRLIALDSGKELFKENLPSTGDLVVTLPAGLPGGGKAKLLVQARAGEANAQVEEIIRLEKPAYVSHLAVNKSVFQAGEQILFRTLTLERFSLKPPREKLALTYSLRNVQGQTVMKLDGQVGPGGIGGGELALPATLASGAYVLQVAEAGTGGRLPPQEHRLEILRDLPAEFQFDRAQYSPGDTVTAQFKARRQVNGPPLANQQVKVQAMVDGKAVGVNGSAPGTPAQVKTDAFGNAPVQLRLPAPIEQGKAVLEAQVEGGSRAEKVVQSIPVVGSHLAVEFFPEGGDLVANVPNRVYYRVRTPLGEPIDPEGYVIVLSSKDVTLASERRQGLGVFTFTPAVNEKYTVRVTSSKGRFKEIREPFQGLKILPEGVALQVVNAVSKEGEPVRVILTNTGPSRRLGILATCRGQIVAEEFVVVPKGTKNVRLAPVAGTRGVVRLTLYDASGTGLVPLAERLLYRAPAERLTLSLKKLKPSYPKGARVDWQVEALDEKGNKAAVWMLAAVLDEKALRAADVQAPSLSGHFYLVSGLRQPEDLDNTDVLLADTPEAHKALDLFLGTQGWRRFVPSEPGQYALAKESEQAPAASQPALFSRENDSPARLLALHEARVQKTRDLLRAEAAKERLALESDKKQRVEEARVLAAELARFQNLPAAYFRLGIGVAALVLLVAGGIFLLVGIVRVAHRSATPSGPFAAAFGSLLACVALYAGADSLPSPRPSLEQELLATLPSGSLSALPEVNRPSSTTTVAQVSVPPTGLFAAAAPKSSALATPLSTVARGMEMLAKREQPRDKDAYRAPSPRPAGMEQRFLQTQREGKAAKPSGKGASAPATAATANADSKKAADKPDESKKATLNFSFARQYAYRNTGQGADSPDTILWYPALFAADGSAPISFDLPRNAASYRILIYGNSPTGRLGAFQGKVQAR